MNTIENGNCVNTTMPISLCDPMLSDSMELVTTCNLSSFYERMRGALCGESETAHEETQGKYIVISLLIKSAFLLLIEAHFFFFSLTTTFLLSKA